MTHFLDDGGVLVRSLSLIVAVLVATLFLGIVGSKLTLTSPTDRGAVIALGLAHIVAVAPSLSGAVITLSDYRSDYGFNGFGSFIIMGAGNYFLIGGAILAGTTIVVSAVREYRYRWGTDSVPREHVTVSGPREDE